MNRGLGRIARGFRGGAGAPGGQKAVRAAVCSLLLGLVAGCGSPVVGAECAEGYVVCDNQCVDLESNRFNCGACGNVCSAFEICAASMCVADVDGGLVDGSPDGVGDAMLDTTGDPIFIDSPNMLDGEVPDGWDATVDGSAPDRVMSDVMTDGVLADGGDAGMVCACDIGELCCSDVCVQTDRDRNNCGECGTRCAADEFCASGSCEPICADPLVLCGDLCIDTETDRDNCGRCGNVCASGICRDGECESASEGHVVLIGHDYRVGRTGQNYLAGNSVFIPFGSEPIEVLVYEGDAVGFAISGVDAAIEQVSRRRGRDWNRTEAPTPADVPVMLTDADVFVVYSQSGASNAILQDLGMQWTTAFMSFLRRGGVIVVFDGGGAHDGTWQILPAAGLFDVGGRTEVTGDQLEVTDRGDIIAPSVPVRYLGEEITVRFNTAPADIVVVEHPDGPVALHDVLSP